MEAVLIDKMGSDLLVVNAARVSFHKESTEFTYREDVAKGSDEGLLSYLASHGHFTPFTHPQICIREKVPIFVARQRFKHVVGFSYNEVSRRYVNDTPELFTPEVWRARPEGSVKQGSGEDVVVFVQSKEEDGEVVYEDLISNCYEDVKHHTMFIYQAMIESGVSPEQARMVLPQSMYTEYYVTGSLAAWARAYKQRIDPHAQKEIQELAKVWGDIIEPLYPVSWKALTT